MNYCDLAIELEYLYEELEQAKALNDQFNVDVIERNIELVTAEYSGDYDNNN